MVRSTSDPRLDVGVAGFKRLLERALALQRARQPVEAATIYRRLIGSNPQAIDPVRQLAVILLHHGRSDRAIVLFRRAIAIIGAHADILSGLALAYHAMGGGSLAKTVWHIAAASDPSNAGPQDGLSMLALEERRQGQALTHLRRIAAAGGPVSQEANFKRSCDLVAQSNRLAGAASPGPRYLVIRPWVCGFWGEVNHVLTQLVLAEMTDRKPIVYWGPEIRYGAPGYDNAWNAYFEPVSDGAIEDVENAALHFFPNHWSAQNVRMHGRNHLVGTGPRDGISSLYLLNTDAHVAVADGFNDMRTILRWLPEGHRYRSMSTVAIYRQILERYIRIKAQHQTRAATIARTLFSPRRPVLAVHYRVQSKGKQFESLEQRPIDDDAYFAAADQFLQRNPGGALFLLTDFQPAMGRFESRYGRRVISLSATRLERMDQQDVAFEASNDGYRLALEVLTDVMLACDADCFLGDGASSVSCSIALLRNWPAGTLTLLRRNVFADRG